MHQTITWNEEKARINRTKHKISFIEAMTVFDDAFSSTINDPEHSHDEKRFATLGYTRAGRLARVSHTIDFFEINNIEVVELRIFSARKPTKQEREEYEETL